MSKLSKTRRNLACGRRVYRTFDERFRLCADHHPLNRPHRPLHKRPKVSVPPPTIDSNEDGKPDAWDRDGNGTPGCLGCQTAMASPTSSSTMTGDGKPDDKSAKKKDAKPER